MRRERATVLSCFDQSGNMVRPWADMGYNCICIDLESKGIRQEGNITFVGDDMRTCGFLWNLENVHIAFFFPPCTDVAVSGARWFKEKGLRSLINALELFDVSIRLAEHLGCPYMIENPVSTISTYWRKPDYTFQPWMYGDKYRKKTCLWTGGGFVMPKPKYRKEPSGTDSRIHMMPPSPERARLRSITPMGFANAVCDANQPEELLLNGTK